MEGPAHRILTDDDDPLLPEGHRRELDEDQEGRQTESVEDK
jgi:nitrogen fixation-related uncharacterized protein